MDVEKIAPISASPLDSCRGRGKLGGKPRPRHGSTRTPRPSPIAGGGGCATSVSFSIADSPTVLLLILPETSTYKVGISNVCSSSSGGNK
jgi:hypothetical protein